MFAYCSTAALLLSLGSSVLAAQGTTTASVSGIVVDDSGRGLEDADVQVINRATGVMTASVTRDAGRDRKSTRLNSSHGYISYAVFCLKKKKDGAQEDRGAQ